MNLQGITTFFTTMTPKKVVSLVLIVILMFAALAGIKAFVNVAKQKSVNAMVSAVSLELGSRIAANTLLAIDLANGISEAWSEAIKHDRDFNYAIINFIRSKNDDVAEIKDTNNEIRAEWQRVKDYIMNHDRIFDALVALYDVYNQAYSLATNPSGSLMTFNARLSEIQVDFDKCVNRLEIFMPDVRRSVVAILEGKAERVRARNAKMAEEERQRALVEAQRAAAQQEEAERRAAKEKEARQREAKAARDLARKRAEEARGYLAQVLQLVGADDENAAKDIYAAAQSLDGALPPSMEEYVGDVYYKEKKYAESLRFYEKALSHGMSLSVIYKIIPLCRYFKNNDDVIKYYSLAIAAFPGNTRLYEGLSSFYISIARYSDAEEILNRALSASNSGDTPSLHNSLGNVYYAQKKYQEAVKQYVDALFRDQNHAIYNYNMGLAQMGREDYRKAVEYFMRAERNGRNDTNLYYNLGKSYIELKKYQDAKNAFTAALDACDDDELKKQIQADLSLATSKLSENN